MAFKVAVFENKQLNYHFQTTAKNAIHVFKNKFLKTLHLMHLSVVLQLTVFKLELDCALREIVDVVKSIFSTFFSNVLWIFKLRGNLF